MQAYNSECKPVSYGSTSSGVAINWSHNLPSPVPNALFVFTEVATGRQTRVQVAPHDHHCFNLNAGVYRVLALAKGCAPYRGILQMTAGTSTPFNPVLNPRVDEPLTMKTALAKFKVGLRPTRDLDVPAGETRVLDSDDPTYQPDWQVVAVASVEAAKAMVGHPDETWGGGTLPRFSAIAVSTNTDPASIARQAAREFVYGNSSSVSHWKDEIDKYVFDESWSFHLFTMGTVTINAGATLVVGQGSNFFLCEKLRMHVTATLLIKGPGPVQVQPLSYESFC
jgi:hypothetical protein